MHTNLPIIFAAGNFDSRNKFSDSGKYPEAAMTKLRTVMDYEIELFSQDGGISHINGMSFPIRKGSLLIAQPGDKRQSTLHFNALFIHFGTNDPAVQELIRSICGFHYDVGFDRFEPELADICLTALQFNQDSDIHASAKLIAFLCRIKKECFTESPGNLSRANYSFISAAIEYMKQSYAEPLTMDQVAEHCGFSTSYLHRLFQESVHMTPNQFLMNIRFSEAKHLLATTTLPISEVAAKCGFSSQAYFSDCFKRNFSISPRQFRCSFLHKTPG